MAYPNIEAILKEGGDITVGRVGPIECVASATTNAFNELSGHRSLTSLQRYIDGSTAREQAEAARGLLLPEE